MNDEERAEPDSVKPCPMVFALFCEGQSAWLQQSCQRDNSFMSPTCVAEHARKPDMSERYIGQLGKDSAVPPVTETLVFDLNCAKL